MQTLPSVSESIETAEIPLSGPFRHLNRTEINRQMIRGFTLSPGPPGSWNRAVRRSLGSSGPEGSRGPIDFNMAFHQPRMPVPRTERRKVARQLAKLEAGGVLDG